MKRSMALFSGGKDSFYAVQRVMVEGTLDLLVSVLSQNGETQLHAGPETDKAIREAQLESIGLPYKVVTVGTGERYLHDLFAGLQRIKEENNIGYLVTGDLWHPYTAGIGDMLAGALNVRLLRPAREKYFSREFSVDYMNELIASGIEAIVISIRKRSLSKDFIGRKIDHAFVDELASLDADVAGESGEYQSFVISAPIMDRNIVIDSYDIQLVDGRNGKEQFYRINTQKFHMESK